MAKGFEEGQAATGGKEPGVIWVTDFTESAAKDFCTSVFKAAQESPKRPILLYIDSYGGYVHAAGSMIAALDSVPNEIVTVAMGKAMSCGALLLSHGDHRFVSPQARILVHQISSFTRGNINDMKVDTKETEAQGEWFDALMAKNCGMSLTKFRKIFSNERRDVYFGAKEALRFGIADKIGVPRIRKLVRYEVTTNFTQEDADGTT